MSSLDEPTKEMLSSWSLTKFRHGSRSAIMHGWPGTSYLVGSQSLSLLRMAILLPTSAPYLASFMSFMSFMRVHFEKSSSHLVSPRSPLFSRRFD